MKRCLLCLALCLLLTACAAVEAPAPTAAPLLGGAANMEEEKTLLRVDGREIPAWRCLYWLARACDAVCGEYRAAGMEPDWTAVVDGRSLAEYVKAQALSDTVLYAVVESWGERYGCTADDTGALLTQPSPELGLDEKRAAELDRVGQMYRQLYELFRTEGSALSPAEETIAVFAEENGWIGYRQIRIPCGEDRDAAREKAAELFARLNAAEHAAAEFEALAAEYGAPAESCTLAPEGEGTDAALRDALEHLAVGQYTGILETADGFSVLLRQNPDREKLLEPCFDALLQRAAEGAAVESTADYAALDVPTFYRSLQRMRGELFAPENGGKTGGM